MNHKELMTMTRDITTRIIDSDCDNNTKRSALDGWYKLAQSCANAMTDDEDDIPS